MNAIELRDALNKQIDQGFGLAVVKMLVDPRGGDEVVRKLVVHWRNNEPEEIILLEY